MYKSAILTEDRKYRFVLYRMWDESKPSAMVIGLNPSTADEIGTDPTIDTVIRVLTFNGFGSFYMVNLFPYVTPWPQELIDTDPMRQEENDRHLKSTAMLCTTVVLAWGTFKQAREKGKEIMKLFPEAKAFGHNKNGSPRHPLYTRTETQLIPFYNDNNKD